MVKADKGQVVGKSQGIMVKEQAGDKGEKETRDYE